MEKIVLRQSCIIINDYVPGDCKRLEDCFKVFDMITHSYSFMGVEFDVENKRLYIPRGVDVFFLEKLFGVTAHKEQTPQRFEKADQLIRYLPRDDVQKEAIRFLLGEGEYKYTALRSQLSLNLTMGKGKTYVTIASNAYKCAKYMIITGKMYLDQWHSNIMEYTDATKKDIYRFEGSWSINKFMNMNETERSKYKVFLASHGTIKSYGDANGWDKITKLFEATKIECKAIDEAHLNFDNTCKIDFHSNVLKTIYITGTPAKSSRDENRIYQLYFKNIPSIDLYDEDNDPHSAYLAIRFNSNPSAMDISNCKNQYGLDRNKYTSYIVSKKEFQLICHIIMNKLLSHEKKNLIYIATNEAILLVYEWIVKYYPWLRNDIGIYTSIISQECKSEQLEKRIILSTTKSAGTAIDIKGLGITCDLAEVFRSEVLAAQAFGRNRDKDTLFIDVVDNSFYYTKSYYYTKKPIYNKYATEMLEMNVKNDELESLAQRSLDKVNTRQYNFKGNLITPFTNKDTYTTPFESYYPTPAFIQLKV